MGDKKRGVTPFYAIDFFAGSGLVTEALYPYFNVAWANDISAKKATTYRANHGDAHLVCEDIKNIKGERLPHVTLAWASFPCQDLSLAGKIEGIYASRSGLVWEWLRVIDELRELPPILVAENVQGLISSKGGAHYADLHNALTERGYVVGPLLLDAKIFLPQSRARIFVVAAQKRGALIDSLLARGPSWTQSSKILLELSTQLSSWAWWHLPEPRESKISLENCLEKDAPFPRKEWQDHNLRLVPEGHLNHFLAGSNLVAAGYKRTRKGRQVLEIRYDGIAGCLRTPRGGSSKQILIFKTADGLKIRFITAREAARLMGAPESYKLPGTYLDGYMAMGDAVALPVVKYLAKHLLYPLAAKLTKNDEKHQEAV
ncbi:MAG: DNA cytosine methyltransferase [Synergistaceae bacterium]|jgi:DNA (cytosine-5)-methyltransferase 1|nr:DNA cytosine methyltransferase [Synergistaceae bacterium]